MSTWFNISSGSQTISDETDLEVHTHHAVETSKDSGIYNFVYAHSGSRAGRVFSNMSQGVIEIDHETKTLRAFDCEGCGPDMIFQKITGLRLTEEWELTADSNHRWQRK